MRVQAVRALRSVFAQDLDERIQILIGADLNPGQTDLIYAALEERPANVSACVLTPPYSTSRRHGGVHPAYDGGSLRTVLSFLANAPYVAYLDDDNAWAPEHLRVLLDAVQGRAWAHTLRLLVDEETGEDLGLDIWDAVGPGRGRFKIQGGMIDPNCLLLDKLWPAPLLWMWSDPGPRLKRLEADRRLSANLVHLPGATVERATVRYAIRKSNVLRRFMREGVTF
jgi:hypothetical protein